MIENSLLFPRLRASRYAQMLMNMLMMFTNKKRRIGRNITKLSKESPASEIFQDISNYTKGLGNCEIELLYA